MTKLLFSPLDAETIIALWRNKIIEAWDLTTEQAHRRIEWKAANTTPLLKITVSQYSMPDAKQSVNSPDNRLNAKTVSGNVTITNVSDASLLRTIDAKAVQNTDLVFSPDSSTLATMSQGPTIRIWSVEDGRQICVVNGDGQSPDIADALKLFYSDDGSILTVYHTRGMLTYWDAKTRRRLAAYWVKDTAISPDGTFFVEPQTFQLNFRKLNDGSLIRTLYGVFDQNLSGIPLGFSPDGKYFGAVYKDGTGHLWGIIP